MLPQKLIAGEQPCRRKRHEAAIGGRKDEKETRR